MAKTTQAVVAVMMAMMALAATRPVAAAEPTLTVAVQVEDLYGVRIQALREAQHEAGRIYVDIGVSLVWVSKGGSVARARWHDVAGCGAAL